jgi:hypothetical protein
MTTDDLALAKAFAPIRNERHEQRDEQIRKDAEAAARNGPKKPFGGS